MADHFLETPEYEQSKNLGLAYLKGAESVKRMTSKYKFCWLVGRGWATFPGSAPEDGHPHDINYDRLKDSSSHVRFKWESAPPPHFWGKGPFLGLRD